MIGFSSRNFGHVISLVASQVWLQLLDFVNAAYFNTTARAPMSHCACFFFGH
jgi:hypothetical protein